jgi:hypothetical protein
VIAYCVWLYFRFPLSFREVEELMLEDLQKFNGTARSEHGADVPLFVASCKFTKQARAFAARHDLILVDVDLLGFWNSGTTLTALDQVETLRRQRGGRRSGTGAAVRYGAGTVGSPAKVAWGILLQERYDIPAGPH